MVAVSNSFEGGTNTTTISAANSGGASGDAFDSVSIGGATPFAFDNARAAHGALSAKLTPAASSTTYAEWAAAVGSQTEFWGRAYIYLTANPAATWLFYRSQNAGTNVARVAVTTAGKVRLDGGSGNTSLFTSTASLTLNAWNRVEWHIKASTTVGQFDVRIFKTTPDGTTADESSALAATQNLGAQVTQHQFGAVQGGATLPGTFWLDDLAITTVGWLGPVATGDVTGTADQTLPHVTQAATGTRTVPGGGSTITPQGTPTLYENVASSSVVVPVPAGTTSGELLVAAITVTKDTNASQRTLTASQSGWTLLGTAQTTPSTGTAGELSGLYCRFATGSEPADYTWTHDATADRVTGAMTRFSGVDSVTPVDVTGSTVSYNNTSGTVVDIPGITTVTNGAMLVSAAALHSSTVAFTAVPSGWTLLNTTTGTGRKQSWAYFLQTTAGATGTITWTKTSGTERRLGILAALRPSTAPPNRTGTITATLPHVTQAAAGTRTLPPGSGPIDQTLPHLTQDLAGSFTSGTGTATLTWGVAGAINSTSFIASSKTVGAASVRVKVATNSGMSTGVLFGGSGTVDGSNWGKSTVTGMTPGTSYWWQMEMTDGSAGVTLSTVAGPVKTAVTAGTPEATTDIGFGSCLESGSTNSVFSRISARSPHLFFHLGDFHYGDNSSTVQSSHLADVEGQFSANSSLRTILRNVPTYAIKSDHDAGGGNNAMPGTYTAPNRAAYKQVFPHPTLSDTNALYWSFVRGRVKFIFTDHRYIRTSTSMMGGATQEAWFKAELQTPEPVKIWVQDGVWTTVETPVGGGDKWSDYPTNHAAIGSWIAANAVGRVVTIHGDQHGLSADDGSNDTRAGIRAMCAAPFDKASSQKGGPWSQGVYPASGTTVVRQHGILHITDTGSVITLAYTGYDSADTSRVTLTTVVNTFAGAAGQTLPHLTQAATGTRSLPAFTGAAAQTLPHVTQAATGTRTIPPRTGTIAQSLPHLTQAATGTRTVPAFTGAAAQALPHVTQAAAGAVTNTNRTGTISQTLPHLTQAAVGTRTVPSGSIVQTLPHVTQAAAGTRTVPAFTGTAGQTLPHLTQALVGTRGLPSGRTGTITITLPHVTQSATGTRSLPGRVGTITQLLPRVTQQARSSVLIVRVREFTGRVVFGRGWSGRIR